MKSAIHALKYTEECTVSLGVRDGWSVRARLLYACGMNPPVSSEHTVETAPEPPWALWKSEKTRKADRRIATSRLSSPRPSHCTGEQNRFTDFGEFTHGALPLTAVG